MKYNKIGIICAMEKEACYLQDKMEGVVEKKVGGITFWQGSVGKKDVILAQCGIGKVFAAMCTQTMILAFSPDCIINSGVAGSLTADLDILDIAVSTSAVQHDLDTSPLGDPVGLISGLNIVNLPADEHLQEEICRHAEKRGIRALSGVIASGDQFIATRAQKEKILSAFSPIACEMEGAAVAQVSVANHVPFCIVRAISDSFTGQNEMDYAQFASRAAERGAALLLHLLEE